MNNKHIAVLAAVCLACVLVIIGEWFYAVREQQHALDATRSTQTAQVSDEMPSIALTLQPEESYVDLVTRPLFINGRRPVDKPSSDQMQAINAASIAFDWQLNGVYTIKNELSALFSRSASKMAKDNYRKIIVGADLDGWRLIEIHQNKVLLKQGEQQKELLLRKPKLKEAPKKANVPNGSNNPQPEFSPPPEINVPPAEGEPEKPNE